MTVYSATQFFNELDLLELRLETLNPVVDYFIISESTKTHSGLDKPLYFEENKDRYKKFHDKIIHQKINYTPNNYDELVEMHNVAKYVNADTTQRVCKHIFSADWFDKGVDSYLRDTFEKEALLYPLVNHSAKDTDVVLLGDLDEIPRPEIIKDLMRVFSNNWGQQDVYHLFHDMFYYYLNLQKVNEPWHGTLATTVGVFKKLGFSHMRTHKPGYKIDNAGWHFTYMGGVDKIKTKVKSWGEQSLNQPYIVDQIEDSVKNGIENKQDLFFRPANFLVRDINDGTFPKYLVEHQNDIFKDYIYRSENG
jgi:beta-1,4-mannosyl-glycoprotein beta-1,4-N-acetylglucosaminyltransferase